MITKQQRDEMAELLSDCVTYLKTGDGGREFELGCALEKAIPQIASLLTALDEAEKQTLKHEDWRSKMKRSLQGYKAHQDDCHRQIAALTASLDEAEKRVKELEAALQPSDHDTCYVTMVFSRDARRIKGNPFNTETPFGKPVAVAVGDTIDEIEAIRARAEQTEG